jgi:hypothetical protein
MFEDLVWSALAPSLLVALLVVLARAVRSTRRINPWADTTWITASEETGPMGTELIGRYLRRVRSHRLDGAVVGFSLALMRGLSEHHSVSIGIGTGSPLADLLLGGFVGLLVGSVLAETWRIKPRGRVREAEIAPRSPDAQAASLRVEVALLTATTVALGLAARETRPLVLAVTSVVLFGTHWLVLRAIAQRGRPVLPADLRDADDAIRRFASRRLSIETLATALLLAGWQLASVRSFLPDLLRDGLIVASAVAAVVLIHRSRPWPPKRLQAIRPPSLVT